MSCIQVTRLPNMATASGCRSCSTHRASAADVSQVSCSRPISAPPTSRTRTAFVQPQPLGCTLSAIGVATMCGARSTARHRSGSLRIAARRGSRNQVGGSARLIGAKGEKRWGTSPNQNAANTTKASSAASTTRRKFRLLRRMVASREAMRFHYSFPRRAPSRHSAADAYCSKARRRLGRLLREPSLVRVPAKLESAPSSSSVLDASA